MPTPCRAETSRGVAALTTLEYKGPFTLEKYFRVSVRHCGRALQRGRRSRAKFNFGRYTLVREGVPDDHSNRLETLRQAAGVGVSVPM